MNAVNLIYIITRYHSYDSKPKPKKTPDPTKFCFAGFAYQIKLVYDLQANVLA